ncbi:SMP-30/gluconolactonase/LRE family protein [Aquimarina sp. 2201CG5-10]|uniref:SMP-30/gluconolactonase/LRE family protein n=1 Tax=Aquimarina callyspongiae TaxID=3098150 RepID=UPI002AB38491|nr:SMP-30/gluconolactonase/LRE family protein [Aquimarina sp. 2201CG5-10]MDY8134475.1 SMP-30/gluconolactonase/LRE family protein [Aquimarina sp. 2201CG5-10]
MRLTKKIIFFILALLIIFVLHTLITTGFFRSIENHFEGTVIKKIKLPGAEDITISRSENFALISSTRRGVYPPQEEEKGGLYTMDLQNGNFDITPLTTSFAESFAPHGISMIQKDSIYKILAINHTEKGHSIEVFSLEKDLAIHKKTITDPLLISPNDVVLIDENRFYVTNDHGYTKGIGKLLEEYAGLSASNVLYYDGKEFKEVASGIAYANGINYDSNRNLLYVASPRGFLIKVYKRLEDGSLDFIEDIDCDTGVDNIEIDPEGNLWTAGHPNLLRFTAYAKGDKETAPSEILKINYRGENDYTVEKIYLDDGSTMSASSVATPFKDLILTGNVMDDAFLVLKRQK